MPDSEPARQTEGQTLAATLRATIARYRSQLATELTPAERQSIERLLAEAEAALSELETPEEW